LGFFSGAGSHLKQAHNDPILEASYVHSNLLARFPSIFVLKVFQFPYQQRTTVVRVL